jgi:hypothetical protein
MITMVWNPSGFHFIGIVSSEYELISSYYQREIFEPPSEWQREQGSGATSAQEKVENIASANPLTISAVAE